MGNLDALQRATRIYASCPSCDNDFRLTEARLFDATRNVPDYARAYLAAGYEEIACHRADLRARALRARRHPGVLAEAVGIGNAVEKIAASLPGFPVASRDCRSLFQPIDYLVFNGLSKRGRIDSVTFVDVKSGNARLTRLQSKIRSVIEAGSVRLLIAENGRKESS